MWGILYKPPLTKFIGDLQWKILHGIVAVNALISILNPQVKDSCVFCGQRKTIFHCYIYCERLQSLFEVLKVIFDDFNEMFSIPVFIYGFKEFKAKKKKRCLLNFIIGKAKMSIYLSRKQKVECGTECNVVNAFKGLVKTRIRHDFAFYLCMKNLLDFEMIWTCGEVLCKTENNSLIFGDSIR